MLGGVLHEGEEVWMKEDYNMRDEMTDILIPDLPIITKPSHCELRLTVTPAR